MDFDSCFSLRLSGISTLNRSVGFHILQSSSNNIIQQIYYKIAAVSTLSSIFVLTRSGRMEIFMVDYIRNQVKDILIDHGVESLMDNNDEEFVLDSIQYVSILMSIEQHLNIDIPDEYLLIKDKYSVNDFFKIVEESLKTIETE